NTLTLTGTAAANSVVKVYDGATLLGSVTANASGAWSFATATLADGAHAFTATATDVAGNVSGSSSALNVTVDTVAPSAPLIKTLAPTAWGAGTTDFTLSGVAMAGTHVQLYDKGVLLGTVIAGLDGTWNYSIDALSSGTHAFT